MKDNKEQEAPVIFWRINEWFPDLSPAVKASLKTYHDELIRANRTLNLISPKTIFVGDAIHFADSILSSKTIFGSNPKIDQIYDFGSGNGFPGLVFAILYPSVKVVLVENDSKKCEFLKTMATTLKLSNVSVECKSVDALPDGSVRYAMARGFSSISKTILVARKSMPKGGIFYHIKGEEWGMEVSEIPTQLCSIWSPALAGEYKLPIGQVKFSIVKTEKIA